MRKETKQATKNVIYFLIIDFLIIVSLLFGALHLYVKSVEPPLKEGWVCSGYQGINFTDATLGCKLKECTPLQQDKYPTQIEKCRCEQNNLTVYRYCDAWLKTKKLTATKQEIENDILQPNYDEQQEEHYQKKQQLNLVPKT